MPSYIVINEPQDADVLFDAFGNMAASILVLACKFMSDLTSESYQGGCWEVRKFPNGALCMALPDSETKVVPTPLSQMPVGRCSFEVISYAAWLIALSNLSISIYGENPNHPLLDMIHHQSHALRDALSGEAHFMCPSLIGENDRELTSEEVEECNGILTPISEITELYCLID